MLLGGLGSNMEDTDDVDSKQEDMVSDTKIIQHLVRR